MSVRFTVSRKRFNVVASLTLMAVLAILIMVPMAQVHKNFFAFGDLRVFYCAGKVARTGSDPYRAEPIGACERALVGMTSGNFVVPAPLPGHAIALFELLTSVDFDRAAAIWSAILAITYFALSIMLTKLTKLPYGYALVVLFPLGFKIPIDPGQLVPVAVALLVAGALALRSKRDALAGILTSISTLEPHIGLPVCVALFLARPEARPALVAGAVAIAAISAHTVGLDRVIEYVGRVLPAHIASEARYDDQYSLTYLLTWLHVPVDAAIRAGGLSYWIAFLASVAAGMRLHRASADTRFLIFVPCAWSVIGGPYVHQEHLLAAVPLAILLVMTQGNRARTLLIVTLGLIAWPAKFVFQMFDVPGVMLHLGTGHVLQPLGAILAETAWAARIAPHAGSVGLFAAKIPTWIGLTALLVATAWSLVPSTRKIRTALHETDPATGAAAAI
jgi:hypothetical protein